MRCPNCNFEIKPKLTHDEEKAKRLFDDLVHGRGIIKEIPIVKMNTKHISELIEEVFKDG